jgi:polar amino acid transport system substrate-binding protein
VRLLAPQLRVTTNELTLEYADELPPIGIHKRRLEQVLVSLLLNACQAIESPAERIEIRTSSDESEVQVEILDEGCGIPEENLQQVLDPFFTTRRETGGTGMGLAISNRIVNMADGKLEIESELGRGTRVRLRFPALPAED